MMLTCFIMNLHVANMIDNIVSTLQTSFDLVVRMNYHVGSIILHFNRINYKVLNIT